jgi:MFS transporter, ACS family, allantoate permease
MTNDTSLTLVSSRFTSVIEIITIYTGVNLAARWKNSIAYVGVIYFIPNILDTILVIALPWSNTAGLLAGVYLTGVGTTGFVLILAWVNQATAGHTKRITMNAVLLIAYCVGNAVGPQMWVAQYQPRYFVPWAIILVCYTICPLLMLLQRYILAKENKRRDQEPHDNSYDDVWVKVTDNDGNVVEKKVDKAFLDLTDRQNREFRYAL